MDEKFLNKLGTDIQLMQTDIKYIREKFDAEKAHADEIAKLNSAKVQDHENRIRNIEKVMYKGLGAAIVFSMLISVIISMVIK